MKRFVVIVAGGKGLRMGADLPKQFIPIQGKPVLMHTLEALYRWDNTARLVLVLPEDHRSYWEMLCREIGCGAPHRIVHGGETRYHSVSNGIAYINNVIKEEMIPTEDVLIGIHDGVRPFVSSEVVEDCFATAAMKGNAIPVIPVTDSVRETLEVGSRPVDRSRLMIVQTPQVFRAHLLLNAYDQPYSSLFTDDASVVEAMGENIHLVEGNRENIKITTPIDLLTAKAFLSTKA